MRVVMLAFAALFATAAAAEQFERIGDVEVHYVVVNTLYLEPAIAASYGIVRARDQAILNVSVVGSDLMPRDATVAGTVRNLLDQARPLEFRRIQEGAAIYFIAPLRYTDQDVLRFEVRVDDGRGNAGTVEFQQRMWVQSP